MFVQIGSLSNCYVQDEIEAILQIPVDAGASLSKHPS